MPVTIDDFDLGSVEEMYTAEIAAEISYLYDCPVISTKNIDQDGERKITPKPAALFYTDESREYTLCGVKMNFIDLDMETDISFIKSVCDGKEQELYIFSNNMIRFNGGIPKHFACRKYPCSLTKKEFRSLMIEYVHSKAV